LQVATIATSSLTYVESLATNFPASTLNFTNGQLVLRFADGYMRSVNSVTVSNINYRFTLNPQPLLNPQITNSIFDLFVVSSDTSLYVQNGTGAGQLANVVKIGMGSNAKLMLTVDSTNYNSTWPINVTGASGTSNVASQLGSGGDVTQPMTFSFSDPGGAQPTYYWGASTSAGFQTVHPTANLSVANSVNSTNAVTATNASYATSANSTVYATSAGNATTATTANTCNKSIGNGQTWQNLNSSRLRESTYPNSTGRSIMVNLSVGSFSGGQIVARAYIDGHEIANYNYPNTPYSNFSGFSFIVPNGSTYSCSISGSNSLISNWSELR
jgi:hypothetical protein